MDAIHILIMIYFKNKQKIEYLKIFLGIHSKFFNLVCDRNHYVGLGLIPKQKPKLASNHFNHGET